MPINNSLLLMIILKRELNYSMQMILINLNLIFTKNYYINLKISNFIHLNIVLLRKKIRFSFVFFLIQLIIFLSLMPFYKKITLFKL